MSNKVMQTLKFNRDAIYNGEVIATAGETKDIPVASGFADRWITRGIATVVEAKAKVEAPKVEAPKVEVPKAEIPKPAPVKNETKSGAKAAEASVDMKLKKVEDKKEEIDL